MSRIFLWGLVTLMTTASVAFAESVQLSNGDVLQGQVVSLDDQRLVLKSDVLGELTIKRSEVESIHLGNSHTPFQTPQTGTESKPLIDQQEGNTNLPPVSDLALPSLKLDDASSLLNQLPKLMPLLENPGVQKHFQRNLEGILSGELDLQDIQKQAQDARDLMRGYEKELGPNAEVVEGYLDILDSFINQAGRPGQTLPEVESGSDQVQ